jgi:hypothetical protein
MVYSLLQSSSALLFYTSTIIKFGYLQGGADLLSSICTQQSIKTLQITNKPTLKHKNPTSYQEKPTLTHKAHDLSHKDTKLLNPTKQG